jgi:hypothetical protein
MRRVSKVTKRISKGAAESLNKAMVDTTRLEKRLVGGICG